MPDLLKKNLAKDVVAVIAVTTRTARLDLLGADAPGRTDDGHHGDVLERLLFSSRRRHKGVQGDWSSDVCSSDLGYIGLRNHSNNDIVLFKEVAVRPLTK